MRLPVVMFANAADISEGLLSVLGGGWSWVERPVPAAVSGVVAAILAVDPTEQGEAFELSVPLQDGEGRPLHDKITVPVMGQHAKDAASSTVLLPFVVGFGVEIDVPTTLAAVVSADGEELGRCVVPVIDANA